MESVKLSDASLHQRSVVPRKWHKRRIFDKKHAGKTVNLDDLREYEIGPKQNKLPVSFLLSSY